jgi:hypothetical protein
LKAVILVIVTANKMEDLEETYLEGMEKEGEVFIEGLQNKKNLAELEKKYSKKVKEIRRIYEKSLKKELNKERVIHPIKKDIKSKQEEGEEFHVKNLDLEERWGEKKQIEITSFSYRLKRKIKSVIQSIAPDYFIYSYYKIKRNINDFVKETREMFSRNWNKISTKISNAALYIKEGFMRVINNMKKIVDGFKKKEAKGKEGEKKEDAKKDPTKQTK